MCIRDSSDVGCLKQLKDIHSKTNSSVLGVFSAPDSELKNYGVIDATQENDLLKLSSIVEKPSINEAPSNLAVFGRYILSKSIFNILEETSQGLTVKYNLLMQLDHFYLMIQFLPMSFKEGVLTAAVRKVMSPQ